MVAGGLAVVTLVLGWDRVVTPGEPEAGVAAVVDVVTFGLFAALAALLIARRPAHPVGWLFAIVGVAVLAEGAAREVALATLRGAPADATGAHLATWIQAWTFAPALTAVVLVLLLFPTGRPPSPRWRWLVGAVSALGASVTIGWAVVSWSWPVADVISLGLPGSGAATLLRWMLGLLLASLVPAAASLVVRYRRAGRVERVQLRWLALAAAGLGVAAVIGIAIELSGRGDVVVDDVAAGLSLAGLPLAVTVAILRHRLYDIDRIISRTVAYTSLTGLLAAVYATVVLLITGSRNPLAVESDLAVAVSTLAVASLFGPLRSRVQRVVDRRFNRVAFDAARTAAAFRERIGAARDVRSVEADLLRVVGATVAPTRSWLWLRSDPAASGAGRRAAAPDATTAPVAPSDLENRTTGGGPHLRTADPRRALT